MPVPDTNPSSSRRTEDSDDLSIPELVAFVKTYAKQETLDPLRGVGRWVGFGAAGALCLGLGLVVVLLGVLRLLEEEWDRSSSGSLSWLAYLITLIVAIALLVVTLLRIKKSTLTKEPK
jgi:uncharacterized BrkB/YihY/UPF0761 family membrane protein